MWDLERVCSWPARVKEEICRATSFISSGTTPDHPLAAPSASSSLRHRSVPATKMTTAR